MTKPIDPVSFELLTAIFTPLIRQIAEEVMAETPKKEPEKRDLTVTEFCEKHHMGLSKYNDFQKNGRGPRVWLLRKPSPHYSRGGSRMARQGVRIRRE